jgi:hypothetical protein
MNRGNVSISRRLEKRLIFLKKRTPQYKALKKPFRRLETAFLMLYTEGSLFRSYARIASTGSILDAFKAGIKPAKTPATAAMMMVTITFFGDK